VKIVKIVHKVFIQHAIKKKNLSNEFGVGYKPVLSLNRHSRNSEITQQSLSGLLSSIHIKKLYKRKKP